MIAFRYPRLDDEAVVEGVSDIAVSSAKGDVACIGEGRTTEVLVGISLESGCCCTGFHYGRVDVVVSCEGAAEFDFKYKGEWLNDIRNKRENNQ